MSAISDIISETSSQNRLECYTEPACATFSSRESNTYFDHMCVNPIVESPSMESVNKRVV